MRIAARAHETTHDLGLSPSVPTRTAAPPRLGRGCITFAWEVPTIEDLAAAWQALEEAGASAGPSDHVVSKWLYGHDPGRQRFGSVVRPARAWGEAEHKGAILRSTSKAESQAIWIRRRGLNRAAQPEADPPAGRPLIRRRYG